MVAASEHLALAGAEPFQIANSLAAVLSGQPCPALGDLVSTPLAAPAGCAVTVAAVDISLEDHYRGLADDYRPTLKFEALESYFPCKWDCDGDLNPDNNESTYSQSCVPSTYVHILKDASTGYTYIEYWYYYAGNPLPLEVGLEATTLGLTCPRCSVHFSS